ncbi:MAG: SGNH/GDSL hydrolase family protein [Gemmatimonadaceae bacterium]
MTERPGRVTAITMVGALLVGVGLLVNEGTLPALLGAHRLQNPATRSIVLLGEIVLVVTGSLLIGFRHRVRGRDIIFGMIPVLLLALICEGVTRVIFRGGWANTMMLDGSRGWVTRPNLHKMIPTLHGVASYSTTRDGFRRWGNPANHKTKVFVIGDSYTHAIGVSDGQTYFDWLASRDTALEVFAYGSSMYGSLQEYLTLDKYMDVIKPDVILWQFCSNDIANNDRAFERASISNNNAMRRPYYQDGHIERHFPYRLELVGKSYLLRYFEVQWRVLRRVRFNEHTLEDTITPAAPLYRDAMQRTSAILGLVKLRAGNVPVVAFEVDRPRFIDHSYERVARENGILFADSIPERIEASRAAGLRVDDAPADFHWTPEGHRIAGEALLRFLVSRHLIAPSPVGLDPAHEVGRSGTSTP